MFVLECDVDCYLGPFAVRFGAVVYAVCHYAFGSLGIEQGRGVAGIDRIWRLAVAEAYIYVCRVYTRSLTSHVYLAAIVLHPELQSTLPCHFDRYFHPRL